MLQNRTLHLSDVRALVHRILMIDELDRALPVKKTLEQNGYTVDVSKDGGQAYATFVTRRPDFVILELILPGESGFEICKRLKKLEKSVPIMALTDLDMDTSRNLAARVGIDGYLTRPYQDDDLLEMVREIGELVWEEHHGAAREEKGSIRFYCRCGRRIAMLLRDRGKATRCPQCAERVDIPQWAGGRRAKFFAPRGPEQKSLDAGQPLKFVTVKCQHCRTYYRLFAERIESARTCPKCLKVQEGALSIVGAPLSRAALASSRRVLIIRNGKDKGKKLLLPEKEVIVGRHESCDIRQNSSDVSRRHCALRVSLEGLFVRDLGSRTGTLVNERPIKEETLLAPGDRLQIGRLTLQLAGHQQISEGHLPAEDLVWTQAEDPAEEFVRAEYQRDQFESTADEAAHIIQQHWELIRRRALMQQAADNNNAGS